MKIVNNKKFNNIGLENVEKIVRSTDKQTLSSLYCKKDLSNMFFTIFRGKPRSNMNKNDVAYSIWNYFHSIDRASAILG